MPMFMIKKELLPERFVRMYKRRNVIIEKNGQYIVNGLNEKTIKILTNFIEIEIQNKPA